MGDTRADAAAGHEHRESLDVVIAAGALCHWCAPELASPDDEGVVEQATLLEIFDERGGCLVDQACGVRGSVFDPTVVVPAAVVELHEAHATFD